MPPPATTGSTITAFTGIGLVFFAIQFGNISESVSVQPVSPAHLVSAVGIYQSFAGALVAFAAPVITGLVVDRKDALRERRRERHESTHHLEWFMDSQVL